MSPTLCCLRYCALPNQCPVRGADRKDPDIILHLRGHLVNMSAFTNSASRCSFVATGESLMPQVSSNKIDEAE